MAIRVNPSKWRCQIQPLLTWILLTGMVRSCFSCHPDSKHFHACLHTFLERDYPLIQTYQAPHDIRSRGRVLLEGPALESICKRLGDLDFCFEDEAIMCRGLYNLEAYRRLMRGFRAVQHSLCKDNMAELMAFLKHGSCLERYRSSLSQCKDERLNWNTVWLRIFRLQAQTEVCPSLLRQRDCVLNNWDRSPCGPDARNFYNSTFSLWLDNWCSSGIRNASPVLAIVHIVMGLLVTNSYLL